MPCFTTSADFQYCISQLLHRHILLESASAFKMAEADNSMAIDDAQVLIGMNSLDQSTTSIDAPTRPVPRKLPKFPIDLNMPMFVYWPEDDDKVIVRSFFLNFRPTLQLFPSTSLTILFCFCFSIAWHPRI
jgi:hypothetical protein